MSKLKEVEIQTEDKKNEDKIALLFIWIYTVVESAATTMVNPLIPAEAIRHGVDQITIGFLFFVWALSALLTSLLLGQVQSMLGRRNIILGSFVLKIFTYFGFIMVSPVETKTLFIIMFAILHITLGMSASAYQTSVYSTLTIMFPDRVDYVISRFEIWSGLGFSFGPAIGSILFSYGGYLFPFYVFLVILIVMTFLTTTFIPAHINHSQFEGEDEVAEVSYLDLLKNKRILFACIILAMNAITYDFLNPILSDVMSFYFGLNEDRVGWMFWLMGIGYVVSCQMVNYTLKYLSHRRAVTLSLFFNGVFILLLGPSNLLGTSARLWVTCIGLFFSGACSAHFVVPVYSELIEPGKHELGIDDNTINDLAAGLSYTVYNLGQMISYTAGGYIYEKAGFSATIDYTAIAIFAVAGAYFVWWDKSMFGTKDLESLDSSPIHLVNESSLKDPLIENIV